MADPGRRSGRAEAPPIVSAVLRSPGRPLDPRTNATMTTAFGRDFSRVRIHTDPRAAEAAGAVHAEAFTVGADVVFGAGRYEPDTAAGRRLLAHELAHAAATGFARVPPTARLTLSDPHGSHEHHAARAALRPAAARAVPPGPPAPAAVVYRQPAPSSAPSSAPAPPSLASNRPPPGTGLRNPDPTERAALAEAEQRRLTILEQALARAGAAVAAATAGTAAALAEFRPAFNRLNLFASTLEPGATRRDEKIALLRSAFTLLRGNHDHAVPPMVIDEPAHDPRGTLYADAGLFDHRDPRRPMIIRPVFFGARPQCQSFVLMHEIFHLEGVLGHGAGDKDWTPEWAVGHPSRLADFAWALATGAVPGVRRTISDARTVPHQPAGHGRLIPISRIMPFLEWCHFEVV